MIEASEVEFFHAPQTRSTGVRLLFAELGVTPRMHLLDRHRNALQQPEYLAVNPMGKVPAIRHLGEVVTEQVAIYVYLGDLFAAQGLAPQIGETLRGPYLRWLAFYGACLEPAAVDRAMKREPGGRAMSPYGDWDTMHGALLAQLRTGPWILGERYTAADVLWGTALGWMTQFGIVPADEVVGGYLERFRERSRLAEVQRLDEADLARLKDG